MTASSGEALLADIPRFGPFLTPVRQLHSALRPSFDVRADTVFTAAARAAAAPITAGVASIGSFTLVHQTQSGLSLIHI